ncbi:hypothetical protein XELAEV_18037069mg [Xenopus laevis]|uniref:GIY-YIG domain-containing protein n=1 Tax=Xenopus laevis TaxID=8355 RepID=A0A974CBK0_XENLA|nr:hypothetical protein XELAEV_18037069mg [Xenopus laevis]
MLTQSYIGERSQGVFPCLSCSQRCCVHKGAIFEYPTTGCKYPLRGYYTYLSKFVDLPPCGLLYDGKTTLQIKTRISQHRSTIRKGNVKFPVSRHFVEKGHIDTDLKYMVLVSGLPEAPDSTAYLPGGRDENPRWLHPC